ncbi:MBL fold metallo-hydrolase [Ureibacillus chungkukjangi]|uniref:Glyoxylase-like metal-dependent hydrolase (Beta-lactamase superfamily II) n=1 Tax=Ureibacillus chungkukjangi TaxID=1202712 RepID=A0A318TRU9_9BACL|nr:MBL fold metallo-hydrolase [Ureibacillus chungkukjangi]MCM3388419.1 MBL fold metallo-hydrolase [Ureibacillus chungkukjangi]PYF07334.1 glyoxylase-like metal-dependent hydrolase (beta-lactamase superfamily II) [Ureibacillus chungkukjangi]
MIKYQTNNVTVFQSVLYKTTSLVIRTEDCILVVDPNLLPDEVVEIRQHVDKFKEDKQIYLIFTHSDWDHIVGYGAFDDAIVIASEEFNKREDKNEIVNQIFQFDDQYYLDRSYPLQFPSVDIPVLEDGQELVIKNTKLTFYKAEGHTNDGIFVVVEPLGVWIAGDYLSDVEFPFIYDNSEKYEQTIGKTDKILSSHNIKLLVPGHGTATDIMEEIIFRKVLSYRYIQELRNTISNNLDHEFLIHGYKYKEDQIKSHNDNVALIKQELQLKAKQTHKG